MKQVGVLGGKKLLSGSEFWDSVLQLVSVFLISINVLGDINHRGNELSSE